MRFTNLIAEMKRLDDLETERILLSTEVAPVLLESKFTEEMNEYMRHLVRQMAASLSLECEELRE